MNKYHAVIGIWIGVGMVGIGIGIGIGMGANTDAVFGIIITAICGGWATRQFTDRTDH